MKRTPLRRVSKKREKENRIYRTLRKQYLSEHPECEMPECRRAATDIHHKNKRGKNLNKVDTWMALCRPCHTLIENNKSWARENNYLADI